MTAGFFHTCTIQHRHAKQKLLFDAGTAELVAGRTLIGATSAATAVIDSVTLSTGTWGGGNAAGYVILKNVTGTFQNDETISSVAGGSAKANGANADHMNQSKELQYYWVDDQTSVPCRFYYDLGAGKGAIILEIGKIKDQPFKVRLPGSVTIAAFDYRITSTATGFTGTFQVVKVMPISGPSGIIRYDAVLQEET